MVDSSKIKETLNLPQTTFSMKAKLAQKEPEIIKKWEEMDLYAKIQEKRKDAKSFILHDGPPYANGNIHLGTAMNKILKDFLIKTHNMLGYRAPYIPGWDCHGLPIEIKVDQKLGAGKKELSIIDFREECKKYALNFVDIQRDQFKRLGVIGEWNEPYLTMHPEYEAEILRHLAAFFAGGNVYKGKKPVHWCCQCRTALAEAEIEYHDHKSPSIYVKFPLISDLSNQFPAIKGKKVSVLIWTTTPWTLPANMAIAFHPEYQYAAVEVSGEVFIAAKRLWPVLTEELGFPAVRELAVFSGRELEGFKAKHPFIDRESLFVLADYVTLDQGTGCVHTAPGHGQEDYLTGLKYGIDIYTPVDSRGNFISSVDIYGGMNVFDANRSIIENMLRDGTMLHAADIVHSYPHCWRCKKPVIFRATSQWFIAMDGCDLRSKAMEALHKVEWIPHWGEERIASMVEARPDWCISRQRSWGVPIPAFICRNCGQILANEEVTRQVADIFEREGANAWFIRDASELLPENARCSECGGTEFNKENNILDVWFESGASHNVLKRRAGHSWPADVYIEGHDQYRGWFNSSLLVGVAVEGASPYKTCITHGFVLDEKGRKMSKSLGNFIEPGEIIERNGAEILRLWVAMLNFKEDVRFGNETLQRLIEAYRKIRNTWRFILGNLYDFKPDTETTAKEDMQNFDLWILERCEQMGRRILDAYRQVEFHTVFHVLYNFFTIDLSSFYLDVLKDRLYCSGPDSALRKSAQTALFQLLKTTLILMAPILPFTAEEAWEALPDFADKEDSVHLTLFPSFEDTWMGVDDYRCWEKLAPFREQVLKELENAREEKLIGNSLEARVILKVPKSQEDVLRGVENQLPALFIVSEVKLEITQNDEIEIEVIKAQGEKCQRCWNYSADVGTSTEYPEFCRRCESVVRELER